MTIEKKNYYVIIISASLAGCCAAYFLALNDYKVLLIDKEKFPGDKICGDALTPPALSMEHK